jgi:cardiolipin synthase A/B
MQMESVFFSSNDYFDSMIQDIESAKKQILIEMFIIENGVLFSKLVKSLESASQRGVLVYCVVDGLGNSLNKKTMLSYPFIHFRIFKPFWNQIFFLKQRNHRKMILIDDSIFYIGSPNIHDKALYWRESGVRVNKDNYLLKKSFWQTWNRSKGASIWDKIESKTERIFFSFKKFLSHKIILTDSSINRFKVLGFLFKKIQKENKRIWIQTPYFNPTPLIFNKLIKASKRNLDVRIIVPSRDKTDMAITKTIDRYYFEKLLSHGVKIYEYIPNMLHSKITLFDNDAIMGSSNWNHRSHLSDLEIDVVLNNKKCINEIQSQFMTDFSLSTQITQDSFKPLNWIQKLYFNIIFLIRKFL